MAKSSIEYKKNLYEPHNAPRPVSTFNHAVLKSFSKEHVWRGYFYRVVSQGVTRPEVYFCQYLP